MNFCYPLVFSNCLSCQELWFRASANLTYIKIKYFVIMSTAAPATKKRSLPLFAATLTKSVPLASEARLLTFQAESESRLEFLAGQFIRIEVKLNGSVVPLVYSIASPPGEGNRFELCLKVGKKGSPADCLCALGEGTEIRFSQPQGVFVLHQPAENHVFLACA